MSHEAVFQIGQKRRLRATFTAGSPAAPADPTMVYFQLRHWENENWTQYPFTFVGDIASAPAGVGAGLVKRQELGVYYVDWKMQLSGRHFYRFVGEGSLEYAIEGSFYVSRSEVLEQ